MNKILLAIILILALLDAFLFIEYNLLYNKVQQECISND